MADMRTIGQVIRQRHLFVCRECGGTRKAHRFAFPRCPRGHGDLLAVWSAAAKSLMALPLAARPAAMVIRAFAFGSDSFIRVVSGVR
mgnify:CR=1 FL=1